MTDFISVPVPSHLVTDVMAYIAQRSQSTPFGGVEPDSGERPEPGAIGNRYGVFVDWPDERLQKVLTATKDAPRRVADMIDVLSRSPERQVPLSELAASLNLQ